MSDIVFQVIDTSCEAKDKSFFVPRVALVTASRTTISTILGYSEYIASSPPKKYKTLTWSGYSEHAFWVNGVGTGDQICGARYDYSGVGQIDSAGNQVSNYSKLLTAMCVDPGVTYPQFINGGARMIGWCNPDDAAFGIGCADCDGSSMFDGGDYAINSPNDYSTLAHFDGAVPTSSFSVVDSTHGVGSGTGSLGVEIGNPLISVLQPPAGRGFGDTIGICTWDNNYSAVLSDEYTDAEALAHALVINSNGATAENFQRTTGFVNRTTSVNFTLNFSNLIAGESYVASVGFLNQNPNSNTTKQYGFVASSTTHVIHDSIATPPAGGTSTVRLPTVKFA